MAGDAGGEVKDGHVDGRLEAAHEQADEARLEDERREEADEHYHQCQQG